MKTNPRIITPFSALALLLLLAPTGAAGGGNTLGAIDITMGPVVVDTSVAGQATISVDVTNNTPGVRSRPT